MTRIEELQQRAKYLETLIENQSDVFVAGYYKALIDNSLLLSDVHFSELTPEFKEQLRNKVYIWSK